MVAAIDSKNIEASSSPSLVTRTTANAVSTTTPSAGNDGRNHHTTNGTTAAATMTSSTTGPGSPITPDSADATARTGTTGRYAGGPPASAQRPSLLIDRT